MAWVIICMFLCSAIETRVIFFFFLWGGMLGKGGRGGMLPEKGKLVWWISRYWPAFCFACLLVFGESMDFMPLLVLVLRCYVFLFGWVSCGMAGKNYE